jgi:dihydrodipicolinate synthase/N-acetylneuraminate lyase
LIGSGRDKAGEGRSHEHLCPSGNAGDLGPSLEGLGSGGAILAGGAVIAAEVEEIVDLIVSGEEALGLAGRLEPLHLPLASSCRLMRVLCPVV